MDYKEILEGVVNIINTAEKSDIGFTNICTYIGENCPELRESEDDRIRKELIEKVKETPACIGFNDKNAVLAWLEKQGKRETLNKVCEWLLNNVRYYSTNALGAEYMCEDLRKAMEE